MPFFSDDEIRENFYIWQMFRDGAVTLVHRQPILTKLIAELTAGGSDVRTVKCEFDQMRELDDALRSVLKMEKGWGRDSFNSQMWDLEFPDCKGLVIVLSKIDEYYRVYPTYFWDILDILAVHCRKRMLMGERLLVVLQADDRNIKIKDVGAVSPQTGFIEHLKLGGDSHPKAE